MSRSPYRSSRRGGGRAPRADLLHAQLRALGTISNLLCKQITAVRNAPVKRHGSKVRTTCAFFFCPRPDTRNQERRYGLDKAEQTVIRADSSNFGLVVAALGAE